MACKHAVITESGVECNESEISYPCMFCGTSGTRDINGNSKLLSIEFQKDCDCYKEGRRHRLEINN